MIVNQIYGGGKENLDQQLNTQDTLLSTLQNNINALPDSPVTAKLNSPVLIKSIKTYTLTNPNSNGNYVTGYKVYVDDMLYKTINQNLSVGQTLTLDYTDDMSAYVGKHILEVELFGDGLLTSERSAIDFTIFTIAQTLTNITSSNTQQFIYENDAYTNTLSASENYYLPSNITLTMGGVDIVSSNYNDYTGAISITNVTGNVNIVATGDTENKLRTPWITLKEKELSIRTVKNATNYYLYMNGEQVWTQEVQLPTYTVEQVSETASQQFQLNTSNYYESQCQKVSNGWSLCKIVFSGNGSCILHCISEGESSYDYGIIGNINQTLASSNTDDGATGSTLVKKNFKGEASKEVKDVVFDTISDGDFIMCKYRKDDGGETGNDSLQFQVEVGL